MCDPGPLRNWLIAIAAAIFVAVAIIVGAAVANGSWWYTYLSPIGMLVAAAATGAAILLCGAALSALTTLCNCTGARCAGQCANLRNTLNAAMVVLGIQAIACLTVALYAWIPGAAQPAQWAIIGALIVLAGLIISAIFFMAQLSSCAAPKPPPPLVRGRGLHPYKATIAQGWVSSVESAFEFLAFYPDGNVRWADVIDRRGPRGFQPGKKPLIEDHCKSSSQNGPSRMFHLQRG